MSEIPPEEFYDQIAGYYDEMTRYKDRLENEKEIFSAWINKYQFKKVLDLGCGSGLHTIVLSELGIETTGVDVSDNMIKKAKKNVQKFEINPPFIKSSFRDLDKNIKEKFDTVLFLGNSLPHIKTEQELLVTFKNIRKLLLPQGKFILQILNYARILKTKERIISINKNINQEYIRFYDILEEYLRFNLLMIDWNGKRNKYKLTSTILYPWLLSDLQEMFQQGGFKILDTYSTMTFESFEDRFFVRIVLSSFLPLPLGGN